MAAGRRVAFAGPGVWRVQARQKAAVNHVLLGGRGYVRYVKPLLDRLAAVLLLILVLPVALLVAGGVALALGRPVIYKQQRVGLGGQPFTIYKFRSMREDRRRSNAGPPEGFEDRRRNHKSRTDPRLTPFGRFIRKTSLDELPQFLNVLRGDMSLIGPRPELVEIVERYEPWQHRRHLVKPGLTGLWQVSSRDKGPMHLNTSIDLCYVDRVTARMDLLILFRTVGCLVKMHTY